MFNKDKKNKKKIVEKVLMGAVIGGAIGSVVGASIKKKRAKDKLAEQVNKPTEVTKPKKKSLIIRLIKSLLPGRKKRRVRNPEEMREIPTEK